MIHGKANVLVVDDTEDPRVPLALLLAQQGYEVAAVASGVDALKTFETAVPDVVLTDLGMKGMSGTLLAHVLGEMHSHLPIIFMTANADVEAVKTRLPPDSVVLKKPVAIEDVAAAIEQRLLTTRSFQTFDRVQGQQASGENNGNDSH